MSTWRQHYSEDMIGNGTAQVNELQMHKKTRTRDPHSVSHYPSTHTDW